MTKKDYKLSKYTQAAGFILMIGGLFTFFTQLVELLNFSGDTNTFEGTVALVVGWIVLASSALSLFLGISLGQKKRWAYVTATVYMSLYLILNLLVLLLLSSLQWSLIVSIIVLGCLVMGRSDFSKKKS